MRPVAGGGDERPGGDGGPLLDRVAALEAAVDELGSMVEAVPAAVVHALGARVAALGEQVAALEAQVVALGEQVDALRRRTALRARPLDDAAIAALAEALATRLGRS